MLQAYIDQAYIGGMQGRLREEGGLIDFHDKVLFELEEIKNASKEESADEDEDDDDE